MVKDHGDQGSAEVGLWDAWSQRLASSSESLRVMRAEVRETLRAWGWQRRVNLSSNSRLLWAWFCIATCPPSAPQRAQKTARACRVVEPLLHQPGTTPSGGSSLSAQGRRPLHAREDFALLLVKHGLSVPGEAATRRTHVKCHFMRGKGVSLSTSAQHFDQLRQQAAGGTPWRGGGGGRETCVPFTEDAQDGAMSVVAGPFEDDQGLQLP